MEAYLYRYYDPNLQRWPNRDLLGELGFEASMRRPLFSPLGEENRYIFAANDPVDRYDLYGLWSTQWPDSAVKACFSCAKYHPSGKIAKLACCVHANTTCKQSCEGEYGLGASGEDDDPVALAACMKDCAFNSAQCVIKAKK